MEPGGAAEGGPARDPDVETVWVRQGQFLHAQRMENLTWRVVGMSLRRKSQLEEQMQA
jgi:hypothetical protein